MLRLNWLGGGLIAMIALAGALDFLKREPGWMLATWALLLLLSGLALGSASVNFQHAVTLVRTRASVWKVRVKKRGHDVEEDTNTYAYRDPDTAATEEAANESDSWKLRLKPDSAGRWPRKAETYFVASLRLVLATGVSMVLLILFGAVTSPVESKGAITPVVVNVGSWSPTEPGRPSTVVSQGGVDSGRAATPNCGSYIAPCSAPSCCVAQSYSGDTPSTAHGGTPNGPTQDSATAGANTNAPTGGPVQPNPPGLAAGLPFGPLAMIVVSLSAIGFYLLIRPKDDRFMKWVKRLSAAAAAVIAAATGLLGVLSKYYEIREHEKALHPVAPVVERRLVLLNTADVPVFTAPLNGPGTPAFLFSFEDEAKCGTAPTGEWSGVKPSSQMLREVSALSNTLARCATPENKVQIETWGFASSSEVADFRACNGAKSSDEANTLIAEERAKAIDALIGAHVPATVVHSYHHWKDIHDMVTIRNFTDRVQNHQYDHVRGALNRRVEVHITALGSCDQRELQNEQVDGATRGPTG
jgi:hypothetical protein